MNFKIKNLTSVQDLSNLLTLNLITRKGTEIINAFLKKSIILDLKQGNLQNYLSDIDAINRGIIIACDQVPHLPEAQEKYWSLKYNEEFKNAQRTLENLLLLRTSTKEPYKTEYLLAVGELKDNLDPYGLLNDDFRKFLDRNIETYKDLIINKPVLFDNLGSYKISLSELYEINLDLLYKTKDEYIKQQYKVREDSLLHHPDSAENQLYKTIKNKNLQQVFEVLFQKQLLFSSGEQDHHFITINEIPKLFDKHIRLFEDEPFDLKVIDFNQNCINLSANKICLISHYLKFFNKELNQLFKENIYEKSRGNRF